MTLVANCSTHTDLSINSGHTISASYQSIWINNPVLLIFSISVLVLTYFLYLAVLLHDESTGIAQISNWDSAITYQTQKKSGAIFKVEFIS